MMADYTELIKMRIKYMSIFTESLSNFICELKNNTLQELSESKPAYNAIKKENGCGSKL